MRNLYKNLPAPVADLIDDYADQALDIIDEEEQILLKSSPEKDLAFYHFTLGIYLKCKFNLWEESNNPVLDIRKSFSHPDEICSLIIYRMWCKLNNIDINIERTIA